MVEPTAQRLTDCLPSVSQVCPARALKCEDLQSQLAEFCSTLNESLENPPAGWREDDPNGLPF